jgi:uncharacterized membrane protein YhhN
MVMSNWVFCAFSELKDSVHTKMSVPDKIGQSSLAFRVTFICSLGLLAVLFVGATHFTDHITWMLVGVSGSIIASRLLISQRYSRLGYMTFLLALLAYSMGFLTQLSGTIDWWLLSSLTAFGVVIFFLLLPKIEALLIPVALMGITMLFLIWSTGEIWLMSHSLSSLLALLGAVLLFISAIVLALTDDEISLPTVSPLLHGTYLISQGLIVISALL